MAYAAVVLGHHTSGSESAENSASALGATISAIETQQVVADAKVLLAVARPVDLPEDWHFIATADGTDLNQAIAAALAALPLAFGQSDQTWIWPLNPGQLPKPEASRAFLAAVEATPSAGWLVPKLVAADNPKVILSFGLTLTRSGEYFERVSNEYDQSQHDSTDDLLAGTICGSWLRVAAWQQVAGQNETLNDVAAPVDLGMRLRLSGWRVVGAPRVLVAQPRPTSGGSGSFARRVQVAGAGLQLRAIYLGFWVALLLGLLQPLRAALQTFALLLLKRPERILSLWWASLAHFFTLPLLLSQRSRAKANAQSRRSLRALYASKDDVNRANRAKYQAIEAVQNNHDADALGDSFGEQSGSATGLAAPRFAATGGFWWLLLVALLSLRFWPSDVAVTGGGLVPLAGDWVEVFNRAGSSWQTLNGGFAAPSDPFNWVLLALASVTAWAPSLGVTLFVFLAKPLAFLGAWRLLGLVSQRPSLLVVGALTYAFWPTASQAQSEGRLGTLVAVTLLPWFAFTIARLLQFGATGRNSAQTWTWLATSALLAAAISAGAPSLTPVVAAVIALLGIYRWRRLGYLIWLPVPLLVLWAPLASFAVIGVEHWAGLLLDPGVPQDSASPAIWQLLLGNGIAPDPATTAVWTWAAGATTLLALLAPVTRRALPALWLWLATALALAAAWAMGQVKFINNSPLGNAPDFVTGSGLALGSLAGLLLVVLAALTLSSVRKSWRRVLASVWLVATGVLAFQFVVTAPALSWGSQNQQPAVVQLASKTGLNLLVLRPADLAAAGSAFAVSLQSAAGLHLEDLSVAQRLALPSLLSTPGESQQRGSELTSLAADLIAANGADLTSRLADLKVGFVLVPQSASSADLGGALDSFAELESVGKTDYGRLWRVVSADTDISPDAYPAWSITKGVQFATLVFFLLLALPTRRVSRRAASDLSEPDEVADLFEPAEVS